MNYNLKELIDAMYTFCDSLDNSSLPLGVKRFGTELSLRKVFDLDLLRYLMYLSASDGKVSWQEADIMEDYLDWNLTTDQIIDFIKENNIYSTSFESEVPLCLKMFVEADNLMYEKAERRSGWASEALIEIYKDLGKELIKSDSDIDDGEIVDYKIYLKMLEEYIRKELIIYRRKVLKVVLKVTTKI